MSNPQHAPSPDYSSHECVDWTVRHCGDCGDVCLTTGDIDRCDTCQEAHLDELETAKRLLRQHARPMVAESFRSGGMNDPRELLCEECGDVALTYTGSADSLDRAKHHCESCGTLGVIDVDQDDEGHVRVRFLGAP